MYSRSYPLQANKALPTFFFSSPRTEERVRSASVELLPDLKAVVEKSDYVLSVVPPHGAVDTARRVAEACQAIDSARLPSYFLDLNAVSPRTAKAIPSLFASTPWVVVLDGGIIGGPPKPPDASASDPADASSWKRPSVVLSGPAPLASGTDLCQKLARVLNTRHVGDAVGAASGLKMCFAALTKGFTALAVQSFTTAHSIGVLPELKDHLGEFVPALGQRAEKGLVEMGPKSWRWIVEMQEIADTMEEFGGFGHTDDPEQLPAGKNLYREIADVYQYVSEQMEFAESAPEEDRMHEMSVDQVVKMCIEGLHVPKHI